jgi:hypothetical protein
VVNDGSNGDRLNLVPSRLLVAPGSVEALSAAGSCGEIVCGGLLWRALRPCALRLMVSRARVWWVHVRRAHRAPHVSRPGGRLGRGLVHGELIGGLVHGELQWWARLMCVASSRWACARQSPRLSTAGSALPGSGREAQMAWSWGWWRQDLEAPTSVLVEPVLFCNGGKVGLVPMADRI